MNGFMLRAMFAILCCAGLPVQAAQESPAQQRWATVDAVLAEVAPDARLSRASGPGLDGVSSDGFGGAVAVSGDLLAVGVPGDAVGRLGPTGSVQVFVREASGWRLDTKLLPPDGATQEHFGSRIALDGDTLLVGLPTADLGTETDRGKVHVFVRSGAQWQFQATLQPADGGQGDRFGHALALSADTALIGGPGASVGGIASYGAVWVYQRAGGSWTRQARLAPADAAANAQFGSAVALDGDRALFGSSGAAPLGAGYVFERVGGTWTERSKLVPSGAQPFANVGQSAALSGDLAVLGAPLEREGASGPQGRAYVFSRDAGQWTQATVLAAQSGGPSDSYASAVAISGGRILVSRPTATLGTSSEPGAVDLWQSVAGTWTLVRTLTSEGDGTQRFGTSLDVDAGRLVVGIPIGPGGPTTSGAVRVYDTFDAPGATPVVLGAGQGPSGRMGAAVAVDADTLVLGAPFETIANRPLAGAVYVFERVGGTWSQQQRIVSPVPRGEALFGDAVVVDGDTLVVGAPGDFGQPGAGGFANGNAWVFVRSGGTWNAAGRLASPVNADSEFFGAALALEGDTLAVGIPGAAAGNEGGQGAVEVFTRNGSNWTAGPRLYSGDILPLQQFGLSLALDGPRLAVGTRGGGTASVFERSGATWNPAARLATASPGDGFGMSVALSGDRLLVGAPFRSVGGAPARGAADFFEYRTGAWVLRSQQTAPEGVAQDLFGWRVALEGDTALVGNLVSGGGPPRPADAVHVFEWRGSNWRLDRRWRPLDLTTGEDFGSALDLDGTTAVVGAPRVSGDAPWGNPEEGVAYVYTHVPDLLFFDDLESPPGP